MSALGASCLAAAPPSGHPITLPFPRVAQIWALPDSQPLDQIARYDYVVLQSPDKNAAIRALNPNIILLNSYPGENAAEVSVDPSKSGAESPNIMLSHISPRWILTQVGTTLSSAIGPTTNIIPVNATVLGSPAIHLFKVGEILVIEDELCRIDAIGTNTLTVKRGVVFPARSHVAGTRAAAAVAVWPGSVIMDLTASCPKVTVDPAVGPESWCDWNARTTAALVDDPTWDGIYIDRSGGALSWAVNAGYIRSIDAGRSNTLLTDYSVFNAAWNSGMRSYQHKVRDLVGDDRLFYANDSLADYDVLNGTNIETFPADNTSPIVWHQVVFGPRPSPTGSYLDWLASSRQPNLSTIETYQYGAPLGVITAPPGWQNDPEVYRRMRFGLTTALLGDGFFSGRSGSQELLWLDEYDNAGAGKGYLGQPLGPARLAVAPLTTPDLLGGDGAFDTTAQLAAWSVNLSGTGYAATKALDAGAARVDITASAGQDNMLSLVHPVAVTSGTAYTLTFRARADRPLNATWFISSPARALSAYYSFTFGTGWSTYEFPCTSLGTDPAAVLRFMLGTGVGTVWIDDVRLQAGTHPDVWRRDFAGGVSLVNPTDSPVTVDLGGTFRKIKGTQAPLVNDGSLVTEVTLPSKDGLVLLRPALSTTISGMPAGWVNHDVAFSLTASDAHSPIGISTFYGLNGPPLSAYATPVSVSAEGTTAVSYFSVDASGNVEPAQSAMVRIDRTPPLLSLDTAGPYLGSATIRAYASDTLSPIDHVELKLDGGPWSTGVQLSTSVVGTHTVFARALDIAGNMRDADATFAVLAPLRIATITQRPVGHSSVKVKKALKLTGTVLPSMAPGMVTIVKTRLVGKKWRGAGSVRVSVARGRFTYSFKPTARGRWRVVATYLGSAAGSITYMPSKSAAKGVTVK